MASFPSPPGNRISYDVDGTFVGRYDGTSMSTLSAASVLNLMDDSSSTYAIGNTSGTFLVFLFPVPMRLLGLTVIYGSTASTSVQYSTDTTNGIDGTWTTQSVTWYSSWTSANTRNGINSISLGSVVGVRFLTSTTYGLTLNTVHFYGRPESATFSGLQLWNAGATAILPETYLDYGDVPQASTSTKSFTVKNCSTTLTATGVVVDFAVLTDTTPAFASELYFSTDNVTFTASVNVGTIGPGAFSPVVYVRRITPSSAIIGLHTGRIRATPTTFA